jgi:hypothetical protein
MINQRGEYVRVCKSMYVYACVCNVYLYLTLIEVIFSRDRKRCARYVIDKHGVK